MARSLPTPRSREFERLIRIASRRYGVPGSTLAGLIEQESGFRPGAVSSANAQGLTQFIPSTAQSYGVQFGTGHHAVATQILGAAKYLKDLGYRKDPQRALGRYYGSVPASYKSEVLNKARKYGWLDRGGSPGGAVSGRGGSPGAPAGVSVSRPLAEPGGQGVAALLTALKDRKPAPVQSAGLPAPAFSAQAVLPQGYQPVQSSGGGGEQGPSLSELLALVPPGEGVAKGTLNVTPGTPSSSGGGRSGGRAVTGSTPVRLAPNADRPGVQTSHYLRRVLSGVQGIPGGITITTGSNHSRLTVDGNVSDHYGGKAADISVPVDSARGDLIAGRTLMRLGVPRRQAKEMARRGGLFNVNYQGHRWQVIWKTNQGGNHHNHVHVGVR